MLPQESFDHIASFKLNITDCRCHPLSNEICEIKNEAKPLGLDSDNRLCVCHDQVCPPVSVYEEDELDCDCSEYALTQSPVDGRSFFDDDGCLCKLPIGADDFHNDIDRFNSVDKSCTCEPLLSHICAEMPDAIPMGVDAEGQHCACHDMAC